MNVYSLDPYKILDLLGDLGGLLDLVQAIGWILTASVVKKAFDISLLSDAYQVQGYNKDYSEFYQSKKAREGLLEQQKQVDNGATEQLQVEDIKVTSSSAEDEERKKELNSRITVAQIDLD